MPVQSELEGRLGRVLIVGGGKMGEAILAGMLSAGCIGPERVTVANPGLEKRVRLEKTYGVVCVADALEAPNPDTCILAVKPQVLRDVLSGLAEAGTFAPARIISIAAGISTATISGFFPHGAIVRAMPNTPLMVGEGMVGVSVGEGTPVEEGELACELFRAMGGAVLVDEALQDAVVAVSGSGPAYFALFVKELAEAGAELGLPEDLSMQLALQTMRGTGELLAKTGQSPDELIAAVSSPGGTTVAALEAMKAAGVGEAIKGGASAAARRSKELS